PMADLKLRQALALKPEGELEPLDYVDGLEQLDPLLEGDLGRVGGGVGERADLANRPHERRDAPVVATQLQNLFDDRPVFALEIASLHARRLFIRTLLDLDTEPALRVGMGCSRDPSVQADKSDGKPCAR